VFLSQVFPVLSPLAIDPAHPFPFIPNTGFSLALQLQRKSDKRDLQALLPIPQQVARFIRLKAPAGQLRFLPLEELLLLHFESLFPGYRMIGHCAFRVLRDSDMEVEEEAEDLVREFEVALKRRRRGEVVRMKISSGAPEKLRALIMDELGVSDDEVIEIDGLIGAADLKELVLDERPDLLWPSFTPRVPERVQDHEGDMFAAIRQKDMLLHHPYETFDMVVRFLKQAALDPDVVAIKQTLYRTSRDSPIVEALCEAAEDGKSVTALVELKARFDEAANIRQSRRLERAGAHVVYGFINYKTHAKVSSWCGARADSSSPTRISAPATTTRSRRASTPTSASSPATRRSGATPRGSSTTSRATPSPRSSRTSRSRPSRSSPPSSPASRPKPPTPQPAACRDLGQDEQPRRGRRDRRALPREPGGREDQPRHPRHLRPRPGIRGLSENIRVKSIIGRFLEHSRIVCFGDGHELPSNKARVYISSADWMDRNLNRRVETLIEIAIRP
jgi:polyphosphate kinase